MTGALGIGSALSGKEMPGKMVAADKFSTRSRRPKRSGCGFILGVPSASSSLPFVIGGCPFWNWCRKITVIVHEILCCGSLHLL
jgi:hypothetical protein